MDCGLRCAGQNERCRRFVENRNLNTLLAFVIVRQSMDLSRKTSSEIRRTSNEMKERRIIFSNKHVVYKTNIKITRLNPSAIEIFVFRLFSGKML